MLVIFVALDLVVVTAAGAGAAILLNIKIKIIRNKHLVSRPIQKLSRRSVRVNTRILSLF